MTATITPTCGEIAELLREIHEQREMFRIALRGVTDEQAAHRSTASRLTLGGLVKHLTRGERVWTRLMLAGDGALPDGMMDMTQYEMADGDTISGLLADYAEAAQATDAYVVALPNLDQMTPLPIFEWAPDVRDAWSARRILLHMLRETAQHAGHADIIRETLDGASTTAQLGA